MSEHKIIPSSLLEEALNDEEYLIRIGAIRSARYLVPDAALRLVVERYERLSDPLDIGEASSIALAIAALGEDSSPIAARLLHAEQEAVKEVLEKPPVEWGEFLTAQIRQNKLDGPFGSLLPLSATAKRAALPPQDVHDESASNDLSSALFELRFWSNHFVPSRSGKRHLEKIETTLKSGKEDQAINQLIETLIAYPDDHVRIAIEHTLAMLGVPASQRLLKLISHDPVILPKANVYKDLSKEMHGRDWDHPSPTALARFFAARALERFQDQDTVDLVVLTAISDSGTLGAYTSRIAARMSSDKTLPALVWHANSDPNPTQRTAANDLLNGILLRDPSLGIRHLRVATTEFDEEHVRWMATLDVSRNRWLANREATIDILGASVRAVPDVLSQINKEYSEAPTGIQVGVHARDIQQLEEKTAKLKELASTETARIVRRFPNTRFPDKCRLNEPERLTVKLVPEAVYTTQDALDIPFPQGVSETEIQVFIRAPGFTCRSSEQIIQIARDGPSTDAIFDLTPVDLGDKAIEVKFYHNAVLIGQSRVLTKVTETQRGDWTNQQILDLVQEDAFATHHDAQVVFYVVQEETGHLSWKLIEPEQGVQNLGRSAAKIETADIDKLVQEQTDLIKSSLSVDLDEKELRTIAIQLQARGFQLFSQVAPPSLQSIVSHFQTDCLIVVDSDADWVPWELLSEQPDKELWGERFELVRAPSLTKSPTARVAQITAPRPSLAKATLVFGDAIRDPHKIARQVFHPRRTQLERDILVEQDLSDIKEKASNADIVHWTCHGRHSPTYHLSYKRGPAGQFTPAMAHHLDLKWGTVVFANACSSGSTSLQLAEFQSFGREFYYAGARPFIGTLGPVPVDEANAFAGLFYKHFVIEGKTAGKAMRLAKQEAMADLKRPIWFFYCLYGNPQIRHSGVSSQN